MKMTDSERFRENFKKSLKMAWGTYEGDKQYIIFEKHAVIGLNMREFHTFNEAKVGIIDDLFCQHIAIISKDEVWLKGEENG